MNRKWSFGSLRARLPEQIVVYPSGSRAAFIDRKPTVVAMCHPEWRGIRRVTHALGLPVVEVSNLDAAAGELHGAITEAEVELVVVNGYPPGTAVFAERVAGSTKVRVLMHSSMTQHGFEPREAEVISAIADGIHRGFIDALGFTKRGQAEAMTALGVPSAYVPAPTTRLDPVPPTDLGPGRHVGVFAEATWRKNVTAQVGAAALLGATAHLTLAPDVSYLPGPPIVVTHGLLDRAAFLEVMASVDLNLGVSLYEAFPVLPQESYWLGVPCLISRTSSLFEGDHVLERLSIVDRFDDPSAIAERGAALLETADAEGIVDRARAWMLSWNERTADQRARFFEP